MQHLKKVFFIAVVVCVVFTLPTTAATLIATFDSFAEGDSFITISDGGITFSDLDERLPQNSTPPHFSIEEGDASILGPLFSPPNYLTTEGFSPGPGVSFGRFGSARITFGSILVVAAYIDVFGFANSTRSNILTLEAIHSGVVVASDSIGFGQPGGGIVAQSLEVSSVVFDELRLVASGPEEEGVVFIGIDNVIITSTTVIEVEIDIKPGGEPNSINCNNDNGVIPVAILTTDDFDATTVDHSTVTFEGASETHVDRRSGEPRRHEEDVDGDGDIDLVFHLRLGETNLTCDSTEGTLTGETFDGQVIEGTDSVNMIGS